MPRQSQVQELEKNGVGIFWSSEENPEGPKIRSVKGEEKRPLACDFQFGQLLYSAEYRICFGGL